MAGVCYTWVEAPLKFLGTLGWGDDGVGLHEPADVRVVPTRAIIVDVTFPHLPGVAIVGWGSAIGVPGRAPGVIEQLAYQPHLLYH